MSKLNLADNLKLPLEAVTETFCILAMRGKGKTHTASVMAEEFLKAGVPVVIYDPTGAWWGLKSSADGKSKAYPVAIFGGDHADIPLEERAGETIARAIVQNRYAAILDVSRMRKGKRLTFMADFMEVLYHENREALHFFADEVHTIAPQTTRKEGGDVMRCLGAIEDIVLQGRIRGLGFTGISQRPAKVHTTIRTQSSSLIAMGMSGLHDIKAVMEWVEVQADEEQAAEMLASLPSLPRGDAWFWSPSAFDIFRRVHFRERETFDSSRTPKVGEARRVPKVLAAPDLDKLGADIKATVEQAKANDPSALKRRIAELEKQAKDRPAAPPTPPKVIEKKIVTDAQVKRVESIAVTLVEEGERRIKAADAFMGRAKEVAEAMRASGQDLIAKAQQFQDALAAARAVPVSMPPARLMIPVPSMPQSRIPAPVETEVRDIASREQLSGPERRIIDAYAWWHSIGVAEPTRHNVAPLAGYSNVNSKGFVNPLSLCRTAGLLDGDSLTDRGRKLAAWPKDSTTLAEYHGRLREVMDGPVKKVFDALNAAGGRIARDALAEASGYGNINSKGFVNPLSRLSSMGLLEAKKGDVQATQLMYPEKLVEAANALR